MHLKNQHAVVVESIAKRTLVARLNVTAAPAPIGGSGVQGRSPGNLDVFAS